MPIRLLPSIRTSLSQLRSPQSLCLSEEVAAVVTSSPFERNGEVIEQRWRRCATLPILAGGAGADEALVQKMNYALPDGWVLDALANNFTASRHRAGSKGPRSSIEAGTSSPRCDELMIGPI